MHISDGSYLQIHCMFHLGFQSSVRAKHKRTLKTNTQAPRSLINADIGPSENINWVATVWTLGTAVGFLLVGRLSDIFGRKWMVMGTTALGLIGCIIGCRARTVNMLIGANVCNGLAAAGQLSFGIVLGELVPNKQRGPIVTLVFLSSMPFAGKWCHFH